MVGTYQKISHHLTCWRTARIECEAIVFDSSRRYGVTNDTNSTWYCESSSLFIISVMDISQNMSVLMDVLSLGAHA